MGKYKDNIEHNSIRISFNSIQILQLNFNWIEFEW